ncbi:hypothetical protein E3Q23_03942 [Wallemia mellicola]|uniref:5'-3' exoribonuclease n=1 Tax=Wallemia mellicola TaxID=1708541 RepID=A0A4T0LNC0_9BASI|nr:hypothetical protein E3Q23_03942 [Wallemia mellicola]TIC62506.1 hypothetical protein E3Q01_03918 [Wallemia mellicola]
MGVPALFRWLSKKYPRIVYKVQEEHPKPIESSRDDDGNITIYSPVDITTPNPNGQEFDCLYLDMNGIVHPCSHPENKPAPETEEEMMREVFLYTERVVSMVRPRKLLMMAIDGVAPRAKMNQQRSRRFRSAQEAKEKEESKQQYYKEMESQGHQFSDEQKGKKAWDSNAITPGTPFMDLLAQSLRYWVAKKMNDDPGWKGLQVVISDASVPGEGEHKIMDYIRRQRSQPNHDANTEHVIYGLDADLIMLALATHEPNFKVLREDVFAQSDKQRQKNKGSRGEPQQLKSEVEKNKNQPAEPNPFIFLDVTTLREYLYFELKLPNMPFPYDLERAIDDWVFMIFFVGNDFLPHLPSLEIREGAIDTLLTIWKRSLPLMGGYVTKHGDVNLPRVQMILDGLASSEDEIFRRRKETEDRQDRNQKRRKIEQHKRDLELRNKGSNRAPLPENRNMDLSTESSTNSMNVGGVEYKNQSEFIGIKDNNDLIANRHKIRMANMNAAEMLKAQMSGGVNIPNEAPAHEGNDSHKRKHPDEQPDDEQVPGIKVTKTEADDEEQGEESAPPLANEANKLKVNADGTVEQEDIVKLWEPGYRERYYRQKFGIELSDVEERRKIVHKYLEGLCWVLKYYYQGCPSWKWYYPYHYAPFAADFENIQSLPINFELGEPFRPFEQLMGVFPAASGIHIPRPFSKYMTEEDSPILDFYPEDFQIDMNGKKMIWQGVALLPFIDENRLTKALSERYDDLSDDEKRRNERGKETLMISESHPLYDQICQLYTKRKGNSVMELDVQKASSLAGFAESDPEVIPGSTFYSPLTSLDDQPDLVDDKSIAVRYTFPEQLHPHKSIILRSFKHKPKQLTQYDIEKARNGGDNHRGGGSHNQFRGNNSAVPTSIYNGPGRPPRPSYGRPQRPPPSYIQGRPTGARPPQGVFSPSLGHTHGRPRPPPPTMGMGRPRPPPPTGGFRGNYGSARPPYQGHPGNQRRY